LPKAAMRFRPHVLHRGVRCLRPHSSFATASTFTLACGRCAEYISVRQRHLAMAEAQGVHLFDRKRGCVQKFLAMRLDYFSTYPHACTDLHRLSARILLTQKTNKSIFHSRLNREERTLRLSLEDAKEPAVQTAANDASASSACEGRHAKIELQSSKP